MFKLEKPTSWTEIIEKNLQKINLKTTKSYQEAFPVNDPLLK